MVDDTIFTEGTPHIRELIIDGSSGYPELEAAFAKHLVTAFELFKKKQKSYGPGNIAQFGEKGVVMRMNDKEQRLINLVFYDKANPLDNESVEDTYYDMSVYGVIALLCREGNWPGVKAADPAKTTAKSLVDYKDIGQWPLKEVKINPDNNVPGLY
jgi:hypothetical protein